MMFLLSACVSTETEVPEISLAEASAKVTFASVETLGAHTYLATSTRTEERRGREVSRHEEVVEIRWQDWDNFSHRRTVDGRSAADIVVVDGVAWSRRLGGPWKKKNDAESSRVQLKTTWDSWEQTIGSFGDQVVMTEGDSEPVEGRTARHYTLSLSELPPAGDDATQPIALSGDLWVDEASAVRLTGKLEGTLGRDGYHRLVELQVVRTAIGMPQNISLPDLPNEGDSEELEQNSP
ncbi:MAG: hypothetical protein ACI8RZ_003546 [Myxococcota bacterium]|jgi:hypothetical protein